MTFFNFGRFVSMGDKGSNSNLAGNMLSVQVELSSGQWREVKRIEFLSTQYVSSQLKQTQASNRGKRVKALDMNGRMIDMLG